MNVDHDFNNPTATRTHRPALTATILYEDFPTGLRANAMLERIVRELHLAKDAEVELLRFDLFQDSLLRATAARAAGHSELVLLSTHDVNGMPSNVNEWISEWLEQKEEGPCALVVLSDPPAKDKAPADLSNLRRLCAEKEVEVFQHFEKSPGQSPTKPVDKKPEPLRMPPAYMLQTPRWDEQLGWGIND